MTLQIFFFLALATWRIASLVANEAGPWQMFERLRQRAEQWCKNYRFCREFGVYELFACEWCNSVWIGAGLTALYLWLGETFLWVMLPLALSTVVIVIKYLVQFLQEAQKFLENNNRAHERLHADLYYDSSLLNTLSSTFGEKR